MQDEEDGKEEKAEAQASRRPALGDAYKKTNLRSENDTFKIQEEQRCVCDDTYIVCSAQPSEIALSALQTGARGQYVKITADLLPDPMSHQGSSRT